MEFVTKRDVTLKDLVHASRVGKFLNMAMVLKYGIRSHTVAESLCSLAQSTKLKAGSG